MDITGKLIKKLQVQSGTSAKGAWAKQDFVLECQNGKYPNTICFNVWGQDKVNELAQFSINQTLQVSFDISSREFNGRWYTDLRAWKITSTDTVNPAPYQSSEPSGFAPAHKPAPSAQPAAQPAVPSQTDFSLDEDDKDLPF